jgi:hypothetical protein
VEGAAASKPAGLYVDMESALCGSVFVPAAQQEPWFADDNQVLVCKITILSQWSAAMQGRQVGQSGQHP